MNAHLKSRGNTNSPILIVGHSLPDNRENIREVLDRRHLVYNSIIIPLKYYVNQYLFYNDKGYILPNDYMKIDDIFMYINAFGEDSSGKRLDEEVLTTHINKPCTKIVLCMGIDVFKAILRMYRGNLNLGFMYKYNFIRNFLKKDGFKNDTEFLGASFNYLSENKGKIIPEKYILPILHNSSNTNFENTYQFVPPEKRIKYDYKIDNKEFIVYFQYIAEIIGDLLLKDEEIKRNYMFEI